MNHSKAISDYHNISKHHFDNYADSLGYLDWVMRPSPFRFYEGVEQINLPRTASFPGARHFDLYERENNPVQDVNIENISTFLELSMALSAWKGHEKAQWSMRINPSSGNLHPTEVHLVLPELESYPASIYHYNPFLHMLEKQTEIGKELWDQLKQPYDMDGFFLGLTTIYWRESWKYGVRGFRYSHIDLGHALAGLNFAANLLGWKCTYLNVLADEDISNLFGLHQYQWLKEEDEQPGLLCFIGPYQKDKAISRYLDKKVIKEISELEFKGTFNRLSEEVVPWPDVRKIIKQTEKKRSGAYEVHLPELPLRKDDMDMFSAVEIIKKRRSAETFDQTALISKELLINMLDKTLARKDHAPFDAEVINSNINIILYIHRVADLAPGLYCFIRNPKDLEELKKKCHKGLKWVQVEEGFPLYLLHTLNLTEEARIMCCHQDIGGTAAFSLAMIGNMNNQFKKTPHIYRHLFWEAGMIGQALYMEAEAYGIQGTGIGSFYDNPVIEMIGIKDGSYQSLYHFAVGAGVKNLNHYTYAPYYHIEDAEKKGKEPKLEDYETL